MTAALVAASVAWSYASALADTFDAYALVGAFELPAGAAAFGPLPDGRLLVIVDADIHLEDAVGTRSFSLQGMLPGADIAPFGAAFLRISPDGSRFAVGNNGGTGGIFEVGVFEVATLNGTWFAANHFDAAWVDGSRLAITAGDFVSPSVVTVLDTNSPDPNAPTNPVVIDGIDGASAGVAFDAAGNLFTGNGFGFSNPSETGEVRAFDNASWTAALAGGSTLSFELDGTLVVDILSASPLGFDEAGNLFAGGGGDESDFLALVRASAIADALAGLGAVDAADPDNVRQLDPDPVGGLGYYFGEYNSLTKELYVRDFGSSLVHVYLPLEPIPVVSTWGMAVSVLLILTFGTLILFPPFAGAALHSQPVTEPLARSPLRTGGAGSGRRGLSRCMALTAAFAFAAKLMADSPLGSATARERVSETGRLADATAEAVSDLGVRRAPGAVDDAAPEAVGVSPFATRVILYDPAPGQFVQHPQFNDPQRALGPPVGGGTNQAEQTSVVTLGGFGGSLTLAFDHVVEDHPLNPFGVDAIVFGNAFWAGGNHDRHFAECAAIEICLDVSADDCKDGPWYVIPGSHLVDLEMQYAIHTWDDNVADSTYPPDDEAWIPPGRSGTWTTEGPLLPNDPFAGDAVRAVTNPLSGTGMEGIWGYADYAPTLLLGDTDANNLIDDPDLVAEAFYTVPDDPHAAGISSGSGGGDAFDIAWAVDPETGVPANLPGFNVIRITSAVAFVAPPLGEFSAEIDAVADVAPDPFGDYDGDDDIDLSDVAGLQNCFGLIAGENDPCSRLRRNEADPVSPESAAEMIARMTGPR